MNLLDIVRRRAVPTPWEEGEKIPWHDPGFSERMLKEHLSQAHDLASRRSVTIDRQVAWIHDTVLASIPTRVLDLGCGPGLYTSRLAGLGHQCLGIDYSPASIAYARRQAEEQGLQCTFVQDDVRQADYGDGFGLVMMIFGEFNVFAPDDAMAILRKAHGALKDQGTLLLEPHTHAIVQALGEEPRSWYSVDHGLFSDRPHLYLQENHWNGEAQVATTRYYIVDAATGEVARHAASVQAYREEQYKSLLTECGFGDVSTSTSLTGDAEGSHEGLFVITARKG
jgi:SAM-dependent methyltransferase